MTATSNNGSSPQPDPDPKPDRSRYEPLQRYTDFVGRVQRLGARSRRADSSRWLLIAGGVLVPLGLFLVILGWSGAASTPFVFEQIPYLISGGLLGVGLMVLGGIIYFSYWLTLIVRETRQERRELIEILSALRAEAAERAAQPAPRAKSSRAR
jgi:hypothetical protein